LPPRPQPGHRAAPLLPRRARRAVGRAAPGGRLAGRITTIGPNVSRRGGTDMGKAAVLTALDTPLEIRTDVEVEPPRAGEVKVRMGASGVCHSDLSMQNGTIMSAMPVVLGHEGAGVIEEVGEGVTNLKPGDHIVVSWVPQCGDCFFCARDQGELCEKANAAIATGGLLDGTTRFTSGGSPLVQMAASGTFSEVSIIPPIGAVKIPDDIPLTVAALVGCGVLT